MGRIQKKKWRAKFSPGSLRHKTREHRRRALTELAFSPKKSILNTGIAQTLQPVKTVNTVQVVNNPPTIKTQETKTEVRTSTFPEHKIPFSYTSPKFQSVSPHMLSEYFKKGNYKVLEQIIMESESPLLVGKLATWAFFIQQNDNFKQVSNMRLNLVIYTIDRKRYLGVYLRNTNELFLICDINKRDMVCTRFYTRTHIPVCDGLNSYSIRDIQDLYTYLNPCLFLYPLEKKKQSVSV